MKKLFFLLFLFPLIAFGQAQLELPYSVKVLNPKPLDAYYFNTGFAPYTSTAQVISQVTASVRYKGQTFNVNGVEYCFCKSTADADLAVKVFDLFKTTNLNQNGHNFAINGQPGGIFTKWDWNQGDLIITDDTTSIDYKLHQNVTNIVFGNTDTLRGSVGYNVLLGYRNKINAPGSGFYGAYFNLVSGTQNSIQNGEANLVGGIFNYGLSDSPTQFNGNFMAGDNSRMYRCISCFSMGTLTGSNYKPLTIGDTGSIISGSFLYSHNSNAQTYGNGIHSDFASILGGSDHNIATGARGSGIFGGRQIHLASGDSNTVAFPKVKMFQGLNASATNDNTITSILGLDGSGNVKTRSSSTFGASPSGTGGTFQFNDGAGNLAATETSTGGTYTGRLTYDNTLGFTTDQKNTGTNSTSFYTLSYPGGVHYRQGISPVINSLTLSPTGISSDVGSQVDLNTHFFVTTDGRIYGDALHNNGGSVTGTVNQYIASGTYTPTSPSSTNISVSAINQFQWIRVGNVVNMSGEITLGATATGAATFDFTLPIGSSFANSFDLSGTIGDSSSAHNTGVVLGDSNFAQLQYNATTTGNIAFRCSITYVVK